MPRARRIDFLKQAILAIANDTSSRVQKTKKLLFGLSLVYKTMVRLRVLAYERGVLKPKKLPCLTISIGNLTVGGTGKTPVTMLLATQLREMGYRVVILCRGYKGSAEKQGLVVSDGHAVFAGPGQAGDEPFLMACLLRRIPVIVGRNRYINGCLAADRFQPDIAIMDDGFQHMQLSRDLNLLLLDARIPLGNGCLLPYGMLREPASAYKRSDALVYTRSEEVNRVHPSPLDPGRRPVFHCRHKPVLRAIFPAGQELDPRALRNNSENGPVKWPDRPLFVFSGLARNNTFHDAITAMGGAIAGTLNFNDHHAYTLSDAAVIDQAAREAGGDILVTTDKDYVRLPIRTRFAKELYVMGISIDFGRDQTHWKEFLRQWLKSVAAL